MIRKGSFALYARWHQKRCAPAVTPKPPTPPTKKAANERKKKGIRKLAHDITTSSRSFS